MLISRTKLSSKKAFSLHYFWKETFFDFPYMFWPGTSVCWAPTIPRYRPTLTSPTLLHFLPMKPDYGDSIVGGFFKLNWTGLKILHNCCIGGFEVWPTVCGTSEQTGVQCLWHWSWPLSSWHEKGLPSSKLKVRLTNHTQTHTPRLRHPMTPPPFLSPPLDNLLLTSPPAHTGSRGWQASGPQITTSV